MKILNLTNGVLALTVTAQLMGNVAFAKSQSHEIILAKSKEAKEDRYFQLKSRTVVELSDEEAMEFAHESSLNLVAKNVTFPNIPPRPPEAGTSLVPTPIPGPPAGGGATTPGTPTKPTIPAPAPTGVLDGVIMIVDKLIAIGQKIIPQIEKGKAIVTNNPMSAVSVLPRLTTVDPVVHEMGDWSIPTTKHFKIAYKNGYGSEVVSFIYSVTFQHSGTYGGKGKYLTGIRASARNINIAWGFDLDASSQLIQISNVGTTSNVVAGATIEMSYTVKNWTRQITTNEGFFIAGDGRLFKMD